MSITRVFRVRIDSDLRQEFESQFSSIALHRIHEASGFISATIYKPTKWAPDEYALISQWESEASLITYYGEEWNQAVIKRGAERFVVACWLHHYQSWDMTSV